VNVQQWRRPSRQEFDPWHKLFYWGVEDTKLSTNKQHTLSRKCSLGRFCFIKPGSPSGSRILFQTKMSVPWACLAPVHHVLRTRACQPGGLYLSLYRRYWVACTSTHHFHRWHSVLREVLARPDVEWWELRSSRLDSRSRRSPWSFPFAFWILSSIRVYRVLIVKSLSMGIPRYLKESTF